MKNLAKLILILMIAYPLIGVAVSSCAGESDCSTAGRAILNVDLRTLIDNVAVNDTLDSLTIVAAGTDSIILNNGRNVTSFWLPLQYTRDTTVLVFRYSRLTTDTLTIRHSNVPQFVSMDCGYEMSQTILSLTFTRNRMDSIRILSNITNTDGTRNLQIFHKNY